MTDLARLLAKVDATLARHAASMQRRSAAEPVDLAQLKLLRTSIQRRVEALERTQVAQTAAAARTAAEYARLANLKDRAVAVQAFSPPPPVAMPERAVDAIRAVPHLLQELRAAATAADFRGPIPGIYFLLDGEDVTYVGQSTNVLGRVGQHCAERTKQFQRWAYVACAREELNELERFYIALLRPRDNISFKPREAA